MPPHSTITSVEIRFVVRHGELKIFNGFQSQRNGINQNQYKFVILPYSDYIIIEAFYCIESQAHPVHHRTIRRTGIANRSYRLFGILHFTDHQDGMLGRDCTFLQANITLPGLPYCIRTYIKRPIFADTPTRYGIKKSHHWLTGIAGTGSCLGTRFHRHSLRT